MGVPVVTMRGESLGSRFGASLVENIGAGALIAQTTEEYIDRAVSLARDTELLDALHAGLRGMMETSPVMGAAAYGSAVETAYEQVWAAYAERAPLLKSSSIHDDSMSMDVKVLKNRIFRAIEGEHYAEAQACTEHAFAAGIQDDMLSYLHTYATGRSAACNGTCRGVSGDGAHGSPP